MRFVDIINKKRYNEELTDKEIQFFVDGVTDGSIPDYQVSALLMAIVLNGMNERETSYLAKSMMHSGDVGCCTLCFPSGYNGRTCFG